MPHETELEMAARHVREGEINVTRQCELVEKLRIALPPSPHSHRQHRGVILSAAALQAERRISRGSDTMPH